MCAYDNMIMYVCMCTEAGKMMLVQTHTHTQPKIKMYSFI